MIETTITNGAITTAAASPRVQRDAPVPRVLTRPPRDQNITTPVTELVVEYPQAT